MFAPAALLLIATVVVHTAPSVPPTSASASMLDPAVAGRFASLALSCVHREYPNKVAHVLASDKDVLPPRKLTPAFYGCFDWHSSVHAHWLLARLVRLYPDAPFAKDARRALDQSLTPAHLDAELRYMKGAVDRGPFERPYGLAWLLQLSSELHSWDDPQANRWAKAMAPLEDEVATRFLNWLPKLSFPVRTGEHSQTAFALGLVLDWARSRGRTDVEALVVERARSYYGKDVSCPLSYEPGGEDFLSPCLAEADLMRRVLPPAEFAGWLSSLLPSLDKSTSDCPVLSPARSTDRSDGKLAHLDGLNLSRAWMLEGIDHGLPSDDPRRRVLESAARAHAESGLEAVTGEHYAGGHWLGSFATYLLTRRGLD